ncbi:MAG: DUF2232 domain-containing protein [Mariprofundaceae bacterium]|nr:DUF2232 domain-containing protein [Mariprofundaceae bacterium]
MSQRSLPRGIEAILANRFSSALLVVMFFAGAVWSPILLAGFMPMLSGMVIVSLHVLTMALICCILYGGGSRYGLEVGLIATAVVFVAFSFNQLLSLSFLVFYVLIPLMASSFIMMKDGLNRSLMLIVTSCCVLLVMVALFGDLANDIKQLVTWQFEMMSQMKMATEMQDLIPKIKSMLELVLPAMFMGFVFFLWTWAMLLGRWFALRYQFYVGDKRKLASFSMSREYAAFLIVLLLAIFIFSDGIFYISLNLLLFVAGLFAFQGVLIAREWLKNRRSNFGVGMMYVVLLIQPLMLMPFVVLGLLDLHFDYRCLKKGISGGE